MAVMVAGFLSCLRQAGLVTFLEKQKSKRSGLTTE
jgi:hypothetical protein